MSLEDKIEALKEIEECYNKFYKLVEEYERLLRNRYFLYQQAVFYKLLSLSSKNDYIFPIRLQYSTYEYNCGMLGENCTKLLLTLDGVLSYGDDGIKQKRKRLVLMIQLFLKYQTNLRKKAIHLNTWFKDKVKSKIQQLPFGIKEETNTDTDNIVQDKNKTEEKQGRKGCVIY